MTRTWLVARCRNLGVDVLVLATDVDAVYDGYGGSEQQAIARATPEGAAHAPVRGGLDGTEGRSGMPVVERTAGVAAIGSLDDVEDLLDGRAGTQVSADGPDSSTAMGVLTSSRESRGLDDDKSPVDRMIAPWPTETGPSTLGSG